MSRDADAKTSRLFDKRTVERNIKKGLITRKDYDKQLKSLDDVAGKGVYGTGEPERAQPEAGAESDGADSTGSE